MSNKTVVIYKSKYGSTKKYAGWIAIKLDADLYELSDINYRDLNNYENIVYGGGIYVGKINGLKFINKNFDKIKNKNITIFGVGLESNDSNMREIVLKDLEEDMIENINIFKFRGGLEYSKLNMSDKLLMKCMKSRIENKDELNRDYEIIMKSFSEPIDLCDKQSTKQLINQINQHIF